MDKAETWVYYNKQKIAISSYRIEKGEVRVKNKVDFWAHLYKGS